MSRHRFDVATWGSLGWCRDLVLASRHGAGCLCRSLFGALFRSLFEHCSWTLFMKHCSQVKKKKKKSIEFLKNFLVGDLIYKIFI